jgi:hypothetical protein
MKFPRRNITGPRDCLDIYLENQRLRECTLTYDPASLVYWCFNQATRGATTINEILEDLPHPPTDKTVRRLLGGVDG